MILLRIEKLGKAEIPLRDSRKYEVVDMTFVDDEGKEYKGRFASEDLRKALKIKKGEETTVREVREFCGFE